MDFETVIDIKSKPKVSTLYVCRNCAIEPVRDHGVISIDKETLDEISVIKLTSECPDCD